MRLFGFIIERESKRVFASETLAWDAGRDQGFEDCFDAIAELEDHKSRKDGYKALTGAWAKGRQVA